MFYSYQLDGNLHLFYSAMHTGLLISWWMGIPWSYTYSYLFPFGDLV